MDILLGEEDEAGGTPERIPIPRWYLGRMMAVTGHREVHPDLTIEEIVASVFGGLPAPILAYLPEFLSVLDGTFKGRYHHQSPMWSIGAYAVGEYLQLTLPERYSVVELDAEAEWRVGETILRSPRIRYRPVIDWSVNVPNEAIPETLKSSHPLIEPFLGKLTRNQLFITAARATQMLAQWPVDQLLT